MNVIKQVLSDPAATADDCAKRIVALLNESLAEKDVATIAVSGGSTPKLLFERMVPLPLDWARVHIFFVDERAVPPTDDLSNFKLANDNLILPAKIPDANIHRIQGELPPEKACAFYVTEIQQFFNLTSGELPKFDIIHQGTGPDAHTASLFPGDPLIHDRMHIASATFSESKGNWRITLLPAVLLAAKQNIFLVTGQDKAEAIHNIFEADYDPKKYPAQLINHDAPEVAWYLDNAAASGLTPA